MKRVKILKYSCENSNKAVATKFSAELGHVVTESTVCNMKNAYLLVLQKEKDPDKITSLPHASRGRHLLLREYKDVASYIKSVRAAGGIVNHSIVIAAAKGIVSYKNPALLKEHGGPLDLERPWAESFLRRLGYIKRKATKAPHKSPEDFAEAKLGFYQRIKSEVETWSIPLALIVN